LPVKEASQASALAVGEIVMTDKPVFGLAQEHVYNDEDTSYFLPPPRPRELLFLEVTSVGFRLVSGVVGESPP